MGSTTYISTSDSRVQSKCLYIQAAGSIGEESTRGIHLRWMLKDVLVEHLPKGDYFQKPPEGFNKPDDYVFINRTPYIPRITTFEFGSGKIIPNLVLDNQSLWVFDINGRVFYVYFRNQTKYHQVRTNINPLTDPYAFLSQYGSNLIEIECKDMLFFAAQFYTTSREIPDPSIYVKTEILSVETNQLNLPKNVTLRKDVIDFSEKIFAENARSIRFTAFNCLVLSIDFEFYDDFINNSTWEDVGKYALSLEDEEVIKFRLFPDLIHARWARYNDGEFVNADNYIHKWNGDFEDYRNQIKNAVRNYIDLSNDISNPLANEYYYLNDDPSDPDNVPLEISNLSILQMAALDYHVARMLGLGKLDFSDEVQHEEQFVYAARYTTIADLQDGQGVNEVKHLAITLPTSINDQRPSLPIDLKQPVPGIISADPTLSTAPSITDVNGYAHDGTARYLSLMIDEITPDEPADSPFYYTNQQFSMAEFTYPVYVGIEYKDESDSDWRIPELPNDPSYVNVISDGSYSQNETVPITIPNFGQPAYIHKETRTGTHLYGSYGVNWFSRAKSSDKTWSVESEIKPSNTLQPPSNVNAFFIQQELPLLLTSQNEQDLRSQITANDKTLIRLTFEYDTNQDMKSYQKAINGVQIPDFNPLPDNEELFADNVEIFFRPSLPKQLFGMTKTVADLPGNPLVSVVTTKDLPLSSATQMVSPNIPPAEFQNYIGGIFKVGADEYIIHNIVSSSNPNHPTFHILKKQISTAFGQNLTIPFDPANYTTPLGNESFMVVENMQNPTTWGNVNPHPLKVQIGNAWSIHSEEVTLTSGQAPDITENTYLRKYRGIVANTIIKKYTDQYTSQFSGLYEITFSGYTLNNHPQYTNSAGTNSVQWYRGTVRIAKESDPNGERKVLKVIRIDNIASGNLVIYAQDESFDSDPLQSGDIRNASVNFYPGYRVYLYENVPCRLTESNIIPQVDGVLEKYSIFGLRSADLQYNNYKSRISIPSIMFAKKLEAPQTPQQPLGSKYATRPDYFGRSSYAFTTTYQHKPFSVTFLRSNDDILLSALYKQTAYGLDSELDSVQDIRNKNGDEFFNDRLLDLANATIDLNTKQFKVYNGYGFPIPNNTDFYNSINHFIDEHNSFYQENLPHKQFSDITDMDTVIIPAHSHPHNGYGQLKFIDFVKQTIQNTYVPLTEIPIIYQHIKSGTYQPIPKSQVIRDRNGVLLNPTSPDFDMAPMMKILGTSPHKTLFVDYTLDGASTSVYFYSVKETNVQMMQSDLSPAVGPIQMVNSFPIRTPEIKSVIPVLENTLENISPKILVNINSYDKIHQIKKVKLYRALNMVDATSTRTMSLVNTLVLTDDNINQDNIWTVEDKFSNLNEVPYGDPLYYRVTVEREIQYAEANFSGQQDVIKTDYAPSEASKLMITTISESEAPNSPELNFVGNENPAEITNVIFKWTKQAYKAKYHLYKMNGQGNWTKLAALQSNDTNLSLSLVDTDLGSGTLPLVNNNGDPIYHHFKILTENTAGLISTEDKILTIGNEWAFNIQTNPFLTRYAPYFSTKSTGKKR